jgi:hypothetical protein
MAAISQRHSLGLCKERARTIGPQIRIEKMFILHCDPKPENYILDMDEINLNLFHHMPRLMTYSKYDSDIFSCETIVYFTRCIG